MPHNTASKVTSADLISGALSNCQTNNRTFRQNPAAILNSTSQPSQQYCQWHYLKLQQNYIVDQQKVMNYEGMKNLNPSKKSLPILVHKDTVDKIRSLSNAMLALMPGITGYYVKGAIQVTVTSNPTTLSYVLRHESGF